MSWLESDEASPPGTDTPMNHTSARAASASRTERLAWPDVAKGVSIIGVVLLHVAIAVPGGEDTVSAAINHVLDPLRMPLFFLVSGLFAGKVQRMTFPELLRRRLWFFLVPYLLWTPVELATKRAEYTMVFDLDPTPLSFYVFRVLTAENMYWFLFVLMLFNVVLRALRGLPRWLTVVLSVSPIIVLPLNQDLSVVGNIVMYLPVFVIGSSFSVEIRRMAALAAHPVIIVRAVSCYVAGFAAYALWYLHSASGVEEVAWWPLPVGAVLTEGEMWVMVRTVGQLLMIPLAVLAAVALSRVPLLSDALQFLGRHTLPIYLGHPIALTLLFNFPRAQLGFFAIGNEEGGEGILGSTSFWVAACMLISGLGGYALWALQRLPIIGWTIAPPSLGALAWKRSSNAVSQSIGARPQTPHQVSPAGGAASARRRC